MAATKTRIPYGYKIVNGKAEIDPEASGSLMRYFQYYLSGASMSTAASAAGLTCSKTTYANLLKRREYAGDDYYPAIIDAAYQKKLIDEWTRRKNERPWKPRKASRKAVKIYKEFKVPFKPAKTPKDPLKCAEVLYGCVRPVK